MKRFGIAVLIGMMCLGLTACDDSTAGGVAGLASASSAEKEASAEEAEGAGKKAGEEKAGEKAEDVSAADGSEAASAGAEAAEGSAGAEAGAEAADAGTAGEVSGTEKKDAGSQEIYADMDGIIFGFMSGVGAWETTLEVAPDGSFTGQFYDANMGETGEGYKNGTIYECAFTGKFSEAEKVDDTSYSAKVEELRFEKEKNGSSEYIEDETLHVMTEPYGLSFGDDIIIYTPDKKVSELSEGFMSWMMWKIPDDAETLGGIGIYNTTGDYVFYPDQYAMGVLGTGETGENTEGEVPGAGESTAYLNLKNAYYHQAMPDYYLTPYVPVMNEAPEKPYQSVTLENLQGRWVNRYREAGIDFVEVLSVNGDRGRIETFQDGEQKGVWNGEGHVAIEDRSYRNVCPAVRIMDENEENLCTIYVRWVNSNAFFDGGFLNEWKREGTAEQDQYLYDTVTMENLQGVWYTESTKTDGLHQVVLTVDEDRVVLFETINDEVSPYWNGGGHAELKFENFSSGIVYPELLIQFEDGPSVGTGAGIYISSVTDTYFYDNGQDRWFVKVPQDYLIGLDAETPENMTLHEDGSAEIDGANHYVVTPGEARTDAGMAADWTVEVTNSEGMNETLHASVDELSGYFPAADGVIWETDINFDGIPDVLLFRGSMGAQGAEYYDCYLSDGKKLTRCKGFEDIPNPFTSEEDKLIFGHLRDGAAAYYEYIYRIEGNKAVETESTRYVYDEAAQDYIPEKH